MSLLLAQGASTAGGSVVGGSVVGSVDTARLPGRALPQEKNESLLLLIMPLLFLSLQLGE